MELEHNVQWFYRFDMCEILDAGVIVWDPETDTEIGEIDYEEVHQMHTAADVSEWADSVVISKVVATNGVDIGTTVTGEMQCLYDCQDPSNEYPPQDVHSVDGTTGTLAAWSTVPTQGPGNGDSYPGFAENFTFENPGWTNLIVEHSWGLADYDDLRCDNLLSGWSGCAFTYFTPVLEYSLSGDVPELAQHIQEAQAAGHPRTLYRLMDQDLIEDNREASCPDSLPRPEGKSCDEYPFASTYQGSATSGTPASVKMIDKLQNSLGGSQLNSFYVENRVVEGSGFTVSITP